MSDRYLRTSMLKSSDFHSHGYSYLPNTLKIMGHTWKLGAVTPLAERLHGEFTDGLCDLVRMEIAIHPEMPPSLVKETLLHEIIEALNGLMKLGLDHGTIQLLGLGLFQVLSDNGLLNIHTGWQDLPEAARQIIKHAYAWTGGADIDRQVLRQMIEWSWPEAFRGEEQQDLEEE